ncbi:MAG: hypothetical protein KatS3mg095_0632 [Candidatus Parcubacteria bacterium]|nr:MAG: hypothetical protein KatS3mg095_0632 [Candidatus Parcubacteria bacterium]
MGGKSTLDEQFWKNYFKVYDVLNYLIPYQELLDELCRILNPQQEEIILDAGVGTGNLAILIEKRRAKVIGLDFSKEALEIYKNKNPNAMVILHNLEDPLPFSDNYFDKIVSNNTIYNIPREKRLEVFKELYRVLKPGKLIVVANIHKNFKPIKIYIDGIKKSYENIGILKTINILIKVLIPTLKIFYYNRIIQKVHKFNKENLFEIEEQKELLEKVGFINISETKFIYSGQAILNYAFKPSK